MLRAVAFNTAHFMGIIMTNYTKKKPMAYQSPLINEIDYQSSLIAKLSRLITLSRSDILGLIGMVFIQGATLPTLYNVMFNNGTPPPATLVMGIFIGLIFYQSRAMMNLKKEWVYAIGNSIGLASNFTLLLYIGGVL